MPPALHDLQADRATQAASWRAGNSGRFSAAKMAAGDLPFMCDGNTAKHGKKIFVRDADVQTPVNAALLSTSPRLAPLPPQRSVDSRLGTSSAELQQQAALGPGSYEACTSTFGYETAYVRVVPPKHVNGLGLPQNTSRAQLLSALVKRCVPAQLSSHFRTGTPRCLERP